MMLYILASGALGFFVFDCYRVRSIYKNRGIVLITFTDYQALFAHAMVYLAAGILALFVNLDAVGRCCGWHWFSDMNNDIVGPLLRGFGIGVAGPAGLSSKGKIEQLEKSSRTVGTAFDDLTNTRSGTGRIKFAIKTLLMM
jgi:hypothetical protein